MATLTSTLLTIEEYLRLAPREDGFEDELIEGEIVLSPNAKPLHANVVHCVAKLLQPLETLGYEIRGDFGCRLGKYSLPGPDLAATRSERWNNIAEEDYLVGSPELVIEVFSPSNRKALMAQKAALYLRYGADAVWVIYPKSRTVTVHDADSQREARCGETVSFHGISVPVAAIFEGL